MKNNKKIFLLLSVLFVLNVFFKIYFLKNYSLTFGYDQARDAVNAQQIIKGNIKVQGPPASTQGIFHGVLWYYFLIIPNIFSKNPISSAVFLAMFNSLNIFIVFYLTFLLTKNKMNALLAALMYAVSFEASQYSLWLSNPTMAAVFVPLIYLSLWIFISKYETKHTPILIGLFLGLSVQSEIFLIYHLLPILFWFAVLKIKNKQFAFIKFILGFLISILSILISEIKFGFKSISGFLSLLSKGSVTTQESLGDVLIKFLNQLGKVYAYNFYPNNIALGSGLIIIFIIFILFSWDKKKNLISWQPFLIIWMLSHLSVVAIGGDSTPFLLVGIGPSVCIFVSIVVYNLFTKKYYYIGLLFFVLFVYGNISAIIKENNRGQTIFSIQKDMILRNEIAAVNYTYDSSNGEMFSINSVTSPLWVNIVWTYLYKNFGQKKYGYLPFWHGRDQIGQVDSLENLGNLEVSFYYLIIEPLAGIPKKFADEEVQSENSKYLLLEEKSFGEIIVQKRILIKNE